jgi:hypothetical protein
MGNTRMGPPDWLVLALRAQLGLREFVETGTFRGGTAAWAAGHFERVTTIELSPVYHAAAVVRFRAEPRIRALQGASPAVLRKHVPGLAGPALFWLDAHWSGLDTAGMEAECPLLEEMAVINDSPLPHVILVDDARLFCAPPPRPHRAEHWPDLLTVVNRLANGGRRHVALFEDIVIAVPTEVRVFLTNRLQEAAGAPPPPLLRRLWREVRR